MESEFSGVLQRDAARLEQLQSHTAKPGHILNRFTWGNTASLKTRPLAAGLDVRAQLLDYYRLAPPPPFVAYVCQRLLPASLAGSLVLHLPFLGMHQGWTVSAPPTWLSATCFLQSCGSCLASTGCCRRRQYGAQRMCLVLLGAHSLSEMEAWARELFAGVPVGSGPRRTFPGAGSPLTVRLLTAA